MAWNGVVTPQTSLLFWSGVCVCANVLCASGKVHMEERAKNEERKETKAEPTAKTAPGQSGEEEFAVASTSEGRNHAHSTWRGDRASRTPKGVANTNCSSDAHNDRILETQPHHKSVITQNESSHEKSFCVCVCLCVCLLCVCVSVSVCLCVCVSVCVPLYLPLPPPPSPSLCAPCWPWMLLSWAAICQRQGRACVNV